MAIRIGKSLTLKWTVFSVLLATIPLAIAGFSIIQIYQDNSKKSVIIIEEAPVPLRQVATAALKWILIALGIAIIFSLFLTRRLTLPIKNLSNMMREVAKGNLDTYIHPTTKDELGVLAESFNQMIQDLRRSRGALKEAEEKYRRIFEDSKDMFYITSADGKVIDVNQAGVDLFGYGSKEEMMQVHVRDTFLSPEDQRRFWNEIRREWFVKDFEVKLRKRDGTPIDVLITANARKDDSGNITSYEGIIKDISDRRRMEEELVKRTRELTILYEIIKISASTLDLDEVAKKIIDSLKSFFKFEALGILWVDENTRRLLPHPASNHELSLRDREKLELCVGKGITRWVAEKGEPLLVNDVRKDGRYISGDERIASEMCLPLKSGQEMIGVIDVQSRELNAFTENDLRLFNIASRQIATVIENIRLQDEIKQSEERYRTVVESALDGVCVIGKDYRFKYVNQKLLEIQGYPLEELIGSDFRNYLDEESKGLLADREDQRKRGVEPSPYFELNILRRDGGMRRVEVSARNIKDSKGDVNTIAILKDITDKKRMEEQLLQTEKLRALGEMASGVAHDFNNALAAILGNTELLLHTAKDEDLRGSLKVIEKVARESAQTVKRLQEFTRKKVRQELFKINVNDVIIDAIEITKPKWKDEAQAKGIHIDIASKFDEISTVVGDASELREVITSMIFNAIDAMPEGGRIEIQAFQKKEKVYIQISDTGVGMAEEVRKKIFEPFFTTKPFSNAGLGLSMSYGIVKRFGGEIEVESILGHGTTFTIILPIGLEGKEQLTVPSIVKKGREARILVIDDEETVRSVLSRILSQVKHRVTVAENGEEGIRLFKEEGFDIVLTDLGMPGISGWEVGKTIKKMSPRTPVGMITGWGEVNQGTIKENGIDFVISKPFQFNQILKVIDETIASRGKLFMT